MTESQIVSVVLAYMDGSKIQQRDVDHRELGWSECPFPNWDFYRVDFRVEPRLKPIEKWLMIRRDGGWSYFDSNEDAEKRIDRDTVEVIHLREVIE